MTIGVHETIGDLRTMLAHDTGISRNEILLAEIDDLTFRRSFKDSDPVTVINDNKPNPSCDLYCIEVLKHKESTEDDGAYVLLTWVNVLKEGPIEKRFGSPYTIQVSREVLYQDLQKLLMKEMASILHDDILIGNQKVPLFNIRVVDGIDDSNYLDANVDLPMYTLAIEQAISLCSTLDQVVPHVKLALEWDMPAKSQVINDDRDVFEEHASVRQVAKCPNEATIVTLEECFGLYTKAEKLGEGDAWFCPQCKRKQEVVKRMGLWSLPDVLIIHLKRFRQTNNSSNKLKTMVECPLEGQDMSPFVTNNSGSSQKSSSSDVNQEAINKQNNIWTNMISTFKKDKASNVLPEISHQQKVDNNAYDLYAVCNHHGDDLQGGHYTATCRNPTDGQWYSFDDMNTSKVDETDVVTQDAYILFYQKQTLSSSSCSSASSSSSSSSSSSAQEHWVYRMPDFNYKNKTSSSLSKAQQQANLRAVTSGGGFQRNSAKYATLPAAQKKSEESSEEAVKKDEVKSLSEEDVASRICSPPTSPAPPQENEDVSRPIDQNDVD